MKTICNLCPRRCSVDRNQSVGYCGTDNNIRIARAALHLWEEPCISGTNGSGAVFFCGCNLKCVYCQNREISSCENSGTVVTAEKLSKIFLKLQELGAHNINLVTPTHYAPQIKTVLELAGTALTIPIVYNCGGYESLSGLDILKDRTSIYLTDIKYADDSLAEKYSRARNYNEISFSALTHMLTSAGSPRYDADGIMQRGVIVRHLVLPGCRHDSIKLLHRLKSEFGTNMFRLSLMSQFTPNGALSSYPELNRRITSFEYRSVTDTALDLGFTDAYTQARSSADSSYTPPFDLTGID